MLYMQNMCEVRRCIAGTIISVKFRKRRFLPPQRLILLGAGHIAQPLCEMASRVEYDVIVVDDRPSFANRQRFPAAKKEYLVQENTDMELLSYLAKTKEDAVYALVIDTKGSTPVKSGTMMAVNSIGKIYGTVGGGCGEHAVMRKALEVIQTKKPQLVCVDMTKDAALIEEEGMVCGGIMQVYIDIV